MHNSLAAYFAANFETISMLRVKTSCSKLENALKEREKELNFGGDRTPVCVNITSPNLYIVFC